jgi:RNA polymerase sigma factor (sigma-70 family)
VESLQAGDTTAFSYLYDNYSAALYGLLLRIVQDDTLAKDLLQESFVKIWKYIGSYDSRKGRLFTWMLNICSTHAFEMIRSEVYKQSFKTLESECTTCSATDGSDHTDNYDYKVLDTTLENLPPEQAMLFMKIVYEGYTHDEVSKELKISLGHVKTLTRSAFIHLRKLQS